MAGFWESSICMWKRNHETANHHPHHCHLLYFHLILVSTNVSMIHQRCTWNCRSWGELDWNSCRRRVGDFFCKIPPAMGFLRPWILIIFGRYPRNQLASKGLSLFWFMNTSCESLSDNDYLVDDTPAVMHFSWLWHPPCCYEAFRQLTYHHPKYVWIMIFLSSRWDMLVPCKGTFSCTCINVVGLYLL